PSRGASRWPGSSPCLAAAQHLSSLRRGSQAPPAAQRFFPPARLSAPKAARYPPPPIPRRAECESYRAQWRKDIRPPWQAGSSGTTLPRAIAGHSAARLQERAFDPAVFFAARRAPDFFGRAAAARTRPLFQFPPAPAHAARGPVAAPSAASATPAFPFRPGSCGYRWSRSASPGNRACRACAPDPLAVPITACALRLDRSRRGSIALAFRNARVLSPPLARSNPAAPKKQDSDRWPVARLRAPASGTVRSAPVATGRSFRNAVRRTASFLTPAASAN